jgi:hypothetical protein
MGALASAIFKILIYLAPAIFLTFYYRQAGVSTRNGKILLTLSNIKILNRPCIIKKGVNVCFFFKKSVLESARD